MRCNRSPPAGRRGNCALKSTHGLQSLMTMFLEFIEFIGCFLLPKQFLGRLKKGSVSETGFKNWSDYHSMKLAALPQVLPQLLGFPILFPSCARHEIHRPRFCFACHQRIGRWRWRPRLQLDSTAWADETLGRGGTTLWRSHAAHGVPCGRLGSLVQGIGSYSYTILIYYSYTSL